MSCPALDRLFYRVIEPDTPDGLPRARRLRPDEVLRLEAKLLCRMKTEIGAVLKEHGRPGAAGPAISKAVAAALQELAEQEGLASKASVHFLGLVIEDDLPGPEA